MFDIDTALCPGVFDCEDPIVLYKKSTIPNAGSGVFANTNFRKGDAITIYSGEKVDNEPNDSEYAIQLQDGSYMFGNNTPQVGNGLGSFINHSSVKKNCEFVEDGDYQKLIIVATKKIKNGNELYTTYSRGYRLKHRKIEIKPAFLLPRLSYIN